MGFNAEEKSILIVDDEVDLREILQFELEDVGYQVHSASQAFEALEIVKNNHIDLVVSDIRMPGGDGILLLDSLRKMDFKDPPVILVSGFADVTMEDAYNKGVTSFLSKPLATEFLLDYIKSSLQDPMERWKKKSEWNAAVRLEKSFPSIEAAGKDEQLQLGKGGFFLHLDHRDQPRLNAVCYFKLTFEDTQSSLEGIATCLWQKNSLKNPEHSGVGLEFKELTDESIVFISKVAQEQQLIPQIPNKVGHVNPQSELKMAST